MRTRWGATLAVALLSFGAGSARAQEADAWVPAADVAIDDVSPEPSEAAPPASTASLGIRVAGAPLGLRLHLRPVDAASGEAFDCAIPCTALVAPGDWAVSVGRTRDVTPLAVNGSPLSLLASGRLDVRFADRGTARAAGVVLLVLGGLALVGALIGALLVFGRPDDGSFSATLDRALGYFLIIPALAGGVMVIVGTALVGLQPWASARWTPDP